MEKIDKGNSAIIVVANNKYTAGILDITKKACTSCGSLIYVSLNRPYEPLTKNLKSKGMNIDKILFIDAISRSAGQEVKDANNCIYLDSAGALTTISITINKAIKTGKFDGLLFDSLSTLLIYNSKGAIVKFVQSLINNTKKKNITAIFTVLKGDAEKGLLDELGMFADKVINY